jgi:hypothetical protein
MKRYKAMLDKFSAR